MRILEENSTNWLVMTSDGSTATKTKSSELNQLLYGHNLWGLIDEGSEIWSKNPDGEQSITIIPGEDAKEYTLQLEDAPSLTLGEQRKTDLIEAMAEMYNKYDGESIEPLVRLYDEVRENMVRGSILSVFLDALRDKVRELEDGWMINGHLKLTFEGEFYHPSTESKKRSGQSVIGNFGTTAYNVNVSAVTSDMSRDLTIDGEDYRLTNKEMTFIGKAIWAVENTPDRR